MPEDLVYIQSRFKALNQKVDPSLIDKDEYPLLVNGRNRNGVIDPINEANLLTGIPVGKRQAICAAANFLVAFVDGLAYYKDFNYPNSGFVKVEGVQLSATVDTIYTELVPESTINYGRLSSDGTPSGTITYAASPLKYSPQALVCQDGVSHPGLIFSNGLGRLANTYEQWAKDNQEFVPIGKQMLYYNGKLYIVSADGNRIMDSVTGRPLDFMKIIDKNGDKLPFIDGNPETNASFRVNYGQVTAIREVSAIDGAFLVCTERSSTLVRPSTNLQFGEPLNTYQFLFTTGAKNQFSVVDVLGDTAIIDFAGIKTFNSILQTRIEGKNSSFSSQINNLLTGLQQDICAATFYDNYDLFAVNTVYGPAIVVYDTISKVFVGIDQFKQGFQVKQFAEVITSSARKLFALTTTGEIYELYNPAMPVETCTAYIGDFCSQTPRIEQKFRAAKLVFLNLQESGTVFATPFTDCLKAETFKQDLIGQSNPSVVPYSLPFGNSSEDRVKSVFIEFSSLKQAWKVGLMIQWAFKASLSFVQINCGQVNIATNYESSAQKRAFIAGNTTAIDSITPESGIAGTIVTLKGTGFLKVTDAYLGGTKVMGLTKSSDSEIQFTVPALFAKTYTLKLATSVGFVYSEFTVI